MSQSSSCESSCEWSSNETDSSCYWTSDEVPLQTINTSSEENWTPPVTPTRRVDISMSHSPEAASLLDSSLSEANWTPPTTPAKRCSPRVRKENKRYIQLEEATPNCLFTNVKWDLFKVMEMTGCQENCTTYVHGLTEYDILRAHSMFTLLSRAEQRRWVHEYLCNNCPSNESGISDPSELQFILCGRMVCQPLWIATLAMSTSRFYDLRKLFLEDSGPPSKKKPRSVSAKSFEAISWMTSYSNR